MSSARSSDLRYVASRSRGYRGCHIATSEVGDRILAFLRTLDPVAYVRYASVYRSFSDVDEFIDELWRIRAEDNADDA